VPEGGRDPLPGGGEREPDGAGVLEELDLLALNPRLRAKLERQSEAAARMTREQKEELLNLCPVGKVLFDEPMSRHCLMGVGGPVEALVVPETMEELKGVIAWAMERKVDYRFWGAGSNTLVRDRGLRGLAIRLGQGFDFLKSERELDGFALVSAGAATPTRRFVEWGAKEGLEGVETLSGCCGTLGGNVLTNAGAGEKAIADFVEEITVVDREGRELTMKRSALRFEYRELKIPKTMAVVRALFRFKKTEPSEVEAAVSARAVAREESQPTGVRSLGCVFKNPQKPQAGVLIEEAGLKGVRIGGARVSSVHANFIINEGKASARDVCVLMGLIRERVKERTGIVLEPEIEVLGEE